MCPGCGLGNRLGRTPAAGRSPLSYAAEEGREAVLKILLAQDDIEVNTKDRRGRSSLSYAVQFGHEAVVKILVARDDVDVNNTDTYGHSPLSYTVQYGRQAVVNILMARDDGASGGGRAPCGAGRHRCEQQ